MADPICVTDLEILRNLIHKIGLKYEIGDPTPADGSCFISSIHQNMVHLSSMGNWSGGYPDTVKKLRADTIDHMRSKKERWTEAQYNVESGVYEDPPMTVDQFELLIEDQSREFAWSDNNGYFVKAVCEFLNIELRILVTNSGTEIQESGVGGPYLIINRETPESKRAGTFHVGLIKDELHYNGHYQFLKFIDDGGVNDVGNQSQGFSPSPLKAKRSKLIRKYLRSPPAKTVMKTSHCNFCPAISASGSELEAHLHSSANCERYYLRNYKTKRVLPILIKVFNCLFCDVPGNIRITSHLQKSERCKTLYFEKFQTDNMEVLQKKLNLLRKQTMPSKVNRKLELEKAKSKRENELQRKTEADMLNSYRKETCFANFLQCYKCKSNYNPGSRRIEEVKLSEENFEDFQTPEMLLKRRFRKFFVCQFCIEKKRNLVLKEPVIGLKSRKYEGNIVFAPFTSDDVLSQMEIGDSSVTCILPCTMDCLNYLGGRAFNSRENDVGAMYQTDVNLDLLLSVIYENEVHKYKQLKYTADRYEGVIRDQNPGLLESAEKVVNDASVTGSEAWRRIQYLNLHPRVQQIGCLSLFLCLSIPIDSEDVLSTILLQEGKVVTVEISGDSSNEHETKYYVHDHNTDSNCSENCPKRLMKDYLDDTPVEIGLLKTKYLATYLTSVQNKINALISNFIKSPSSNLFSEEYSLQLFFKFDGTIDIRGLIWLKSMEDVNVQFAKYPTVPLEKNSIIDCINNLDSVLSATSDEKILRKKFNISEVQSKKLSDLVNLHQFHYCGKDKRCQNCRKPKLPVLRTLLLEFSSSNLQMSFKLNDKMLQKLVSLEDEEVLSMRTEEWLLKVFNCNKVKISEHSEDSFAFNMDSEEFLFKMDERLEVFIQLFHDEYPDLTNNSVLACYHYAASTSSMLFAGGAIMERVNIRDSYIVDYNVALLKAFQSKIEIVAVNGHSGILDKLKTQSVMNETEDMITGVSETHQEVPVTEAFCLFDKKFVRSFTSNPVEFVPAFEVRKKFFKQVKTESDKSYKVKDSMKLFVQLLTGIERFFLLENDSLNLCSAEFILNYNFSGEEESKNLLKLFSKVAIKDSDKTTVFSKNCFLPEVLVLKNNDVMQLRSKVKVLTFPSFEKETFQHMYRQVLLFSPEAKEEMSKEEVVSLFNKVDEEPFKDEKGYTLTIIERMERMLFDKKNPYFDDNGD